MEEGKGTGQHRSIRKGSRTGRISAPALAFIAIVILAGVGIAGYWALTRTTRQIVEVDGSSTVFPITSAWAEEFSNAGRQVVVAFSGTGGGFAKFCRGETDLNDASRPIKSSETATCTQNGITGIVEFKIAYDGLSIVVHKDNNWVDHLTVDQLCRIWTSNTTAGACNGTGPQVDRWNELNASWPNQLIELYGPGTDSGTFDYFVEAILGNVKSEHRDDYFASEDDNVLVQGCANGAYALCYFGYAYVVPNLSIIKAVAIDDEDPTNGDGPVAPSGATIQDGSYAPLSRPLFIYGNAESLSRPVVRDFLRFGYTVRGTELVADTGYVALTAQAITVEVAKISG